ncbi:MucR family transcriptional regulator [Methylobacterium sp. NEAU K]|uniref:MucR family transcriptional regulator n=1 Tax=Methylobacterium sp. NEAU K TaxID=3064946 RepID=UPI0027363D4E|nr:MucR family transcriptional regulator [Methylobacterium sp. NEAU K]MDP4003678.1 MucR family transcriptional regulator [Methylobacterium sp. NEAU K]
MPRTTVRYLEAHEFVALAARTMSAYVAHNHVAAYDLPKLLTAIHRAFCDLDRSSDGSAIPASGIERPSPGQITQSVTKGALISFIDGRPYRMLKRHLTAHGLTPEQYRTRYGLPADYPMTAPSYAAQRSAIAKRIGLGVPGAQATRHAAE